MRCNKASIHAAAADADAINWIFSVGGASLVARKPPLDSRQIYCSQFVKTVNLLRAAGGSRASCDLAILLILQLRPAAKSLQH